MLGPDRFTFETPNVIDPGEMPPSRPSRQHSNNNNSNDSYTKDLTKNTTTRGSTTTWKNDDGNNHATSSDLQVRNSRNYKPQLSQGIKLSDYRIDDYYKDDDGDLNMVPPVPQDRDDHDIHVDDDDDAEHGRSSQLPSCEQARLFAATMLTESDRRQKADKDTATTTPGGTWRFRTRSKAQRDRQRRLWHNSMIGVVLLVLAAAFLLAVVLGVLQVRNSNSNDMTPRMTATIDLLSGNGISHHADLTTSGTPQNRAALWMANEDRLQLDIPPAIGQLDMANQNQNQTTTTTTTTNPNHPPPYPFVQRYALAVFYYSTQGDDDGEWTNSLQFVSDQHECSWFQTMPDDGGEIYAVGVTCDQELRVRNLLIPSNNCQGTIPNEIRHLTYLDFLSLKHNQLSGTIPPSLGQATNLNYLDLKSNLLTGTIPKFLGDHLQKLQVLGLSNNQLQGSLPDSLGTLRFLKTLAIDDNFLTGSLDPVQQLTNLEFLYAENNALEAQVDDTFFDDFQRLIELDLSHNHLESTNIPAHLFSLHNLQILDLSDNNLQGVLPEAIPHNLVLEYLSLRRNQILGPMPESIANLARLEHLDVEANAMTGQLPASLGELTDLTYLFVGKNPWTAGTIPEEWQSLTKLRELSLDNAKRTGEIPSWIPTQLNQLKLLDVRQNELTGAIPDDVSSLKQLIYLLLSDNKLTGPIPESIDRMAELSIVALHHNGLIGAVNGLCKTSVYSLDVLTTDCGAVSCPCCDACCDSDDCYDDVVWDSLEHSSGSWEENFQVSEYSFNPHILNGGSKHPKALKQVTPQSP